MHSSISKHLSASKQTALYNQQKEAIISSLFFFFHAFKYLPLLYGVAVSIKAIAPANGVFRAQLHKESTCEGKIQLE
jgi:hypothetical protein